MKPSLALASAYFCGILFSLGLGISGMTQPQKVTAFLDFFGEWDPSLMFVMVGAISTYAILYRLILKRPQTLLHTSFQVPPIKKIDKPLVIGSALFGVGWGLAGFCPAPALTSLVSLEMAPLVFGAAMCLGMILYQRTSKLFT